MFLSRFILTFGFIGYFPIAPGTAGSIIGVLISYFLYQKFPYIEGQAVLVLLIILLTVLGAYLCGKYNQLLFGKEDPGKVVVDEVAGVLIATSLPNIILQERVSWWYFLAGFMLFRFFDITKILGIKRLEKIPNGWGVMLDDTLAGMYSLLLLILYQYWFS